MLRPVSRKSRELVRELDVASGSSFKTNAIVQAFIQLSYNMQCKDDSPPAGFERFVRIILFFLTILAEFVLFNSLRTNFGACIKLTSGLTLDCKSLLLREYKNIDRMLIVQGDLGE